MPSTQGPYRVVKVITPHGPRWKLAGPGLEGSKAYPWEEVRNKLAELAEVMNFAHEQGRRNAQPPGQQAR